MTVERAIRAHAAHQTDVERFGPFDERASLRALLRDLGLDPDFQATYRADDQFGPIVEIPGVVLGILPFRGVWGAHALVRTCDACGRRWLDDRVEVSGYTTLGAALALASVCPRCYAEPTRVAEADWRRRREQGAATEGGSL